MRGEGHSAAAMRAVFMVLILAGVALASTGLVFSYSYWFDELYSVNAARASLHDAFALYILPDVHPPAFTILLHGWIELFGTAEIATRAFSFACVLTAFGIMAGFVWRLFDRLVMLSASAILSTSWLFIYYAQEVRSYGLMLLGASAVTAGLVMYMENGRRRDLALLLGACFVLSWTHYFGLIYAGLAMIAALIWCWPLRLRMAAICATGVACLAWVMIHYTLGEVGDRSGGFWIASNGYQSTISRASAALTPEINRFMALFFDNSWRLEQVCSLAFVAVFIVAAPWLWKSRAGLTLSAIVAAFIAVVGAIDYAVPVSTTRNFIVLLPAMATLMAIVIGQISVPAMARYGAVLGFCLVSLGIAYGKIQEKQKPFQNIRAAVSFMDQRLAQQDGSDVYVLTNHFYPDPVMQAEFTFYSSRDVSVINKHEIDSLEPPFYILALQQTETFESLMNGESVFEFQKYVPHQSNRAALGSVLYVAEHESLAASQ